MAVVRRPLQVAVYLAFVVFRSFSPSDALRCTPEGVNIFHCIWGSYKPEELAKSCAMKFNESDEYPVGFFCSILDYTGCRRFKDGFVTCRCNTDGCQPKLGSTADIEFEDYDYIY